MNASFSAGVYDTTIWKFAQIWTPMRWGRFESNCAVGAFAFGVREQMCSDNRFYTLDLPWRRYFHMGAIPNLPYCVWNALCLAGGQYIPWKGEGAEIVSDLSVNLCPSGLSCGCFCVVRAMLDMPFQWDHCKIKLLLNYILLAVLNWVKVGTPVLKLWVEMLVLEWNSKCCLDKINHFAQIFQVHVTCFNVIKHKQ